MSKTPKKSDMGKAWIKPRRNIGQMVAPEYHLIVSEGTDTEPAYFQSIKSIVESKYRGRIFLDISGKGDNTISLFNKAQDDVKNSNIVYKHVWLVYDKDDFPAAHFDKTAELCRSASNDETTYHEGLLKDVDLSRHDLELPPPDKQDTSFIKEAHYEQNDTKSICNGSMEQKPRRCGGSGKKVLQ